MKTYNIKFVKSPINNPSRCIINSRIWETV